MPRPKGEYRLMRTPIRTALGLVAVLALAFAMISPQAVLADPPKKVDVDYNLETNELHVVAYHDTPSVNMHRVSRIAVTIRGKTYAYDYEVQSGKDKHEAKLIFRDVKKGDEIKVRVDCNVFGSRTVTIVAGEQPKPKKK